MKTTIAMPNVIEKLYVFYRNIHEIQMQHFILKINLYCNCYNGN